MLFVEEEKEKEVGGASLSFILRFPFSTLLSQSFILYPRLFSRVAILDWWETKGKSFEILLEHRLFHGGSEISPASASCNKETN